MIILRSKWPKNVVLSAVVATVVCSALSAPLWGAVLSNGTGVGAPYGGAMCADVQGANGAAGTPVQIWSCYGGLNQQFSFASMPSFTIGCGTFSPCKPGGPYIEIRGVGGSLCLDATGSGTSPGTPVQVFNCNQTSAQAWMLSAFGQIININSGLCLDSGSQTIGTQLVINPCVGSVSPGAPIDNTSNPPAASQLWQLK